MFVMKAFVVFELEQDLREEVEVKVKVVVEVLVIEGVRAVPDELVNVDQVVLDEGVQLVYYLQVMDVSVFAVGAFFHPQKQDKFHDQFFNFLIELHNSISAFPSASSFVQIVPDNYFGDDKPDNLVVGIDQIVAA